MQLNIHDSTLKRVGFINNNLPDALHYFDDNWHRYLAEGTSTFDFSVNKVNSSYALLTLQSYISFTYDGEDYLFNIINIEQDHYSMHLQCENLNLELISEEVGAYGNTKRHSIVWYLKNVAKITNDFVEIGNNPFPLNDEDSSNPNLSFDSTDTKLARIISICNSFNAEFQFRTQLKNDGTLQNITIDLYKEEGVGQKRKDVTLYYGKNIAGITSKADRTSTFFNATTVTDSKNKFNWLSVEGKHYNSDGQLEFYKNAGDNTAYAPLSRDMFPSQLKSSSSDRYTRKNLSIEATSANSLWDYAVSQFKLYAYPQMTYEVSVAVNAVTSALGNDRKLDIGDTIIVQDKTFDKSDGGLILSARVSEQEISFTNPHDNKITFTNFVKLKSEISADLYGRMKDLVDQNTPYKAEVETTNGLQFKNGKGSTTLTARIYFGSDSTETKADSYEWRKDGTLVANVQEITVDASEIDGKAVYAYKATVNEKVVGTASVTITNVNDGATGIPGQPGADGKTSYLHIAYATNSTGTTGFDVSNATGKTYIGQYTDFTSADSTDPSKYTWSLIKGDKGDKGDTGPQGPQGERGIAGATGKTGSPGPKGADGRSSYIHIKYAPVINPTDSQITDTPNAYIGVYTDYNQADSTSASAYTWSKWQGEDGANGVAGAKGADGRTTYVHFAYANSTNGQTNFSTSYFDGALYMGTLTDYTQTDSTNYAAYTWSRLKGDKGDKGDQGVQGIQGVDGRQGIPGPKGADGKTQYTHIAYANSADGVTDFSTSDSNRAYIGMYVDFNVNDSTTPSDYSWTLVKGADGTQGTPGKAGADGKTSYLHIAYATNSTGTAGFDVSNATGKTYIGQYTDFTSADSTDPSKYTWSLIKGDKGDKGAQGNTGPQGPTGPAGSDGNPGKVVSDEEPTTKFKGLTWKYIGITAVDASDGTNIQPNTEYYWNGKNWVINLIKAQNIDVEKLTALTANLGDATAGSLTVEKGATGGIAVKDGLVKSWDVSKMTDPNYPDGYSYTSMGVALDSGGLTIYSAGYGHTLDKGGVIDPKYKVASLQAIASNGRNSIGTGLVLNATNSNFPFTINGNIDVIGGIRQTSKTTSVTIGAGLTLSLERRGETVIAILDGEINSSLYPGQQFSVGQIPLGYRPNTTANIPAHMTSSYNGAHIDAGIDGACTWWGPSTSTGYPRGSQMWFTNDSLPN